MFTETARAKINLNLYVGGLIEDPENKYYGYHPISSLVTFADIGDRLSCQEANKTTLTIDGPFSTGLEADCSNLVLKAYQAVAKLGPVPELSFHLEKNLPIASGIGGGSADAAAALRLLKNYIELSEKSWEAIALSLGADVPVCYYSKTCVMSGIGEQIDGLAECGQINVVLANPGQKVSTKEIFKAYDQAGPGSAHRSQSGFKDQKNRLFDLAIKGENDFLSLIPEKTFMEDMSKAFDDVADCRKLNMSGTGATFYGVFDSAESALAASRILLATRPDWWVQTAVLGDLL